MKKSGNKNDVESPIDDKYFLDAIDFEQTGKYSHAISAHDKILDSDPDNIEALRGKARCLLAAANWRVKEGTVTAYECLKKILDSDPDDADATAKFARCLILLSHVPSGSKKKQTLRRAESILKIGLKSHPKNPEFLRLMCSAQMYLEDYGLVEKYLHELEEIDYNYDGASNVRGILALQNDDYGLALKHFDMELEREPATEGIAGNKIESLYRLDRIDDLIEYADSYTQDYGNKFAVLYLAGYFCYVYGHHAYNEQLKLLDEFQEKFEPVDVEKKKKANDKEYMSQYARALKKYHDTSKALNKKKTYLLEKAILYFNKMEHDKIDDLKTKYYKAQCYLDCEDFVEARSKIDEIIAKDPYFRVDARSPPILSAKAYVLYRLGAVDKKNYEQAILVANQVLENEPKDPFALSAKTNSLFCLGRDEEYRKCIDEWRVANRSHQKEDNEDKTISIKYGDNYTNRRKYTEFMIRCKGHIWISDDYVHPTDDFDYLDRALTAGMSVNEIRILTGFRSQGKTAEDHQKRIDGIKESGKLLKAQYKELDIRIRLTNLRKYAHDRYLFTKDRVWNSVGTGVLRGKGQMSDIQLVEPEEIAEEKIKFFNELWEDKSTFKLYGDKKADADYTKIVDKIKQLDGNID